MIAFDIETGPLPVDELKSRMPQFEAPKNYKDPVKIEANIAEQQAKWLSDAALKAECGRALAVGVYGPPDYNYVTLEAEEPSDEINLLEKTWMIIEEKITRERVVGFNIFDFDLPFLARRSLICGASIPATLYEPWNRYHPWHRNFVDLMQRWQFGDRRYFASLDNVCRALGIGSKPEGMTGADFARVYLDRETREKALKYLKRDLELTYTLAERMGVMDTADKAEELLRHG